MREKVKRREPRSMPQESSDIDPLPMYPNVKRKLGSCGAALLLIYFQTHLREPQDFTIRRVQVDLQIGEQTFWKWASAIAAKHDSVAQRISAQRAGREFYRMDTHVSGSLKCYSITRTGPGTYSLRMNHERLRSLLLSAGAACLLDGDSIQLSTPAAQSSQTTQLQGVDGFALESTHIASVSARDASVAAKQFARKLQQNIGLGDGRRKTGIKRSPHTRRGWTEERRARFEATIAARGGGPNDVCSVSPLESSDCGC